MKGSSKQLSSDEEMRFESHKVEAADCEGNFEKDSNSEFRKRIRRIKTSETEPIMLGRIVAITLCGRHRLQARLVVDFRSINKKLRRPEIPLEGSWNILRRLDPRDKYFACVDFSSGFSQLPLDEGSRGLFNIILPWGKYRYCVLPREHVLVLKYLT